MKLEIYGRSNCSYCRDAMQLCRQKGLSFSYYDVVADRSRMDELKARFPHNLVHLTTVPQIFIGKRHIGGFDDLKAFVDSGEFQQIIGGR